MCRRSRGWSGPRRRLPFLGPPASAERLWPGHIPTQNASCSAVGNYWDMSATTSAMMISAAFLPTPAMVMSRSRASAKGAITSSSLASMRAIGLAARDLLDVGGVDQQQLSHAVLEGIPDRLPLNLNDRGLHDRPGHSCGAEPASGGRSGGRDAAKCPRRVCTTVSGLVGAVSAPADPTVSGTGVSRLAHSRSVDF